MDAPLADLLVELAVDLYDSSITDPGFFGFAAVRDSGQIALGMPSGRDEFERDTVARMLLGKMLDIPMPPLPEGFETTVLKDGAPVTESPVLANGRA
ncbi:hypothetical protein [Streptomyces sp. CBMA152]|uniref:hypothetical protein n=1 Tax=Streptomyces sp. CBMA152 TaxID=1896312 RepID=UPI0016617FA3|nr:hypothetical protein [Streptomyces sp. CBMA152]